MDALSVASMWREAMYLVLMLVLVMILPSLLVGLLVSTFQAATQINEQTLSFLPRLLIETLRFQWYLLLDKCTHGLLNI